MTAKLERVVLDTNVLISGILFRSSTPRLAAIHAFEVGEVLSCPSTRNELREVAQRTKFDRYLSLDRRLQDVEEAILDMVPVVIREEIRACVDPRDDKFLELAVNGGADVLVTGDEDLLRLHPFRAIRIVTPAGYLSGTNT